MKKRNIIIIIISTITVLLLVIGVSYATYTYTKTGANQQLVLGDIYMHYNETNTLTIENMMPSSTYDKTKYFEFTIDGKNTYQDNNIYYEILLSHGDNHETRTTRIKDNLLKFTLVEIKNNIETVVVDSKSYDEINNTRIYVNTISKNTLNEVNVTYRLYMWITNDINICGEGMSDCDYYINVSDQSLNWNNTYASIKVNVKGDFEEKTVPTYLTETFKGVMLSRTNSYIEEDETYYISGTKDDNNSATTADIDFNYVWYSGKLWRITAINPDGTLKMITEDAITTISWGSSDYVAGSTISSEWSRSWIRQWLNQEFLPTLYNHENIIVEDARWDATLYTDIYGTPIKPTGNYTTTDPVGLLNIYEAVMSKTYLRNNNYWWLITVSGADGVGNISDGYNYSNSDDNGYGVRPVVNLQSDLQLKGGSGTKNDPYILKEDQEEITSNVTLLNTRQSGEYVKIENDKDPTRRFRIVGTETINGNLTTKLVLDDYLKIKSTGENLKKYFSNDNTYGDGNSLNYWDYFLNTHWITSLDTSKLEMGTYYLGSYDDGKYESYKSTVCHQYDSSISIKDCIQNNYTVYDKWIGYVGLLRVGEMFASQPELDSSNQRHSHFLITPVSNTTEFVNSVRNLNYLGGDEANDTSNVARPTINLKSDMVIKSGSGTSNDPYIITLNTYEITDGESVGVGGGAEPE